MSLSEEQRTEIKQEVSRFLELWRSELRSSQLSQRVTPGEEESDLLLSSVELKTVRSRSAAYEKAKNVIEAAQVAIMNAALEGTLQSTRPFLEPLVEVIARAIEVLGTREKALHWMNAPVRSLNNQTPASLLGTPEGIAQVEDALGQIEHGVW